MTTLFIPGEAPQALRRYRERKKYQQTRKGRKKGKEGGKALTNVR